MVLHISDLDKYVDTKPMFDDPLYPLLPNGDSAHNGGSTPSKGSATAWAHLTSAPYMGVDQYFDTKHLVSNLG